MLFAHLKRILRLDRLRLRGPNGARDEFLLAATAQNLRKLAKLIPLHARPGLSQRSRPCADLNDQGHGQPSRRPFSTQSTLSGPSERPLVGHGGGGVKVRFRAGCERA